MHNSLEAHSLQTQSPPAQPLQIHHTPPANGAQVPIVATPRQRLWQRLQQPGDHWFFVLYFSGLALLFVVVSLLKLGMRWL